MDVSVAGNMANPLAMTMGAPSAAGASARARPEPEPLRAGAGTNRPEHDHRALSRAPPTLWHAGAGDAAPERGARPRGCARLVHDVHDLLGPLLGRGQAGSLRVRSVAGGIHRCGHAGRASAGARETAEIPLSSRGTSQTMSYWGEAEPERGGTAHLANRTPTLWPDALGVARYHIQNADRLYRETRRFHDTLFDSTLPAQVLDAVSSQASILHSPTVLRLPDAPFTGSRAVTVTRAAVRARAPMCGTIADAGLLFPALERSMRRADLYLQHERKTVPWAFGSTPSG